MKPGLFEGITHVETVTLGPARAPLPGTHSGALLDFTGYPEEPPVFATAFFVGLVEWACMRALLPYLDAEERAVGARVELRSGARAPVGGRITAIVEIARIHNGRITFDVRCRDAHGTIAEGVHDRDVVIRRAEAPELLIAC